MGINKKVCYVDIETGFNLVEAWRAGNKVRIGHENVKLERQIISIQYSFYGQKTVKVLTWTMPSEKTKKEINSLVNRLKDIPGYNKEIAKDLLNACCHSDYFMLKEFIEDVKDVEVFVAHNGKRFDMRWLKGRLLFHRLPALVNRKVIDTLNTIKYNFDLNSYRLDYASKYLLNDGKIKTEYEWWQNVIYKGDKKYLHKLCYVYGPKDIVLLKKVEEEIRPYSDELRESLNVIISNNRESCPNCFKVNKIRDGSRGYKAGIKQRWRCKECGYDWPDTRAKSTTDKLKEEEIRHV